MHARDPLTRIGAFRMVARPSALDSMTPAGDDGTIVLRTAPDEILVLTNPEHGGIRAMSIDEDPDAIFTVDGSWHGAWVEITLALELLQRHADWDVPIARPALAQGLVAGLPVKVWLERERALFVVPAAYAADFEERVR